MRQAAIEARLLKHRTRLSLPTIEQEEFDLIEELAEGEGLSLNVGAAEPEQIMVKTERVAIPDQEAVEDEVQELCK